MQRLLLPAVFWVALMAGTALAQVPAVLPAPQVLAWTPISGSASDLSIGGDGAVFALDSAGQVWLRRPTEAPPAPGGNWIHLPGKFSRIAAAQERLAWAVDAAGGLFFWNGTWWRPMGAQFPVNAVDVGVAPDGKAFAATRSGTLVALDLQRGMTELSGLADAPANIERVDVDEQARPWVLTREGKAYRLDGRRWQALATSPARDLSVGGFAEGGAWFIGPQGELSRLAPDGRSEQRIAARAAVVAGAPNGKPWIATADGTLYANDPATLSFARPRGLRAPTGTQVFTQLLNWQQVTGNARQLAISAKGAVLALGQQGEVWNWKAKNTWGILPGKFAQIALDAGGSAWGIDTQGKILRYQGNYWEELPGSARLIATAADGGVWILAAEDKLAKWQPRDRTWVTQAMQPLAGIKRFALDADTHPWIIDGDGQVQRFDGKAWVALPDISAGDLALGPEGTAFVVDTEQRLWRWDAGGKRWEQLNGAASGVAVGPRGIPWIIRGGGDIYAAGFFDDIPESQVATVSAATVNAVKVGAGGTAAIVGQPATGSLGGTKGRMDEPLLFQKLSGAPRELAIGADGSVFAVNFDGTLLRWNNARNNFLAFPGQAARIAVAPDGKPWGVTTKGEVFRHDGTDWRPVYNITASDIAVGFDSTVMVVGPFNILHRFNPLTQSFERLAAPTENTPPPGGVRVALDPQGTPWVILADGYVARCEKLACQRIAMQARDIAIGPEGSVFIVDNNKALRRWDARSQAFERIATLADPVERVAVGPRGKPWLISGKSEPWSSAFFPRDESRDIATSATGSGNTTTSNTPVFTFSTTMMFDALGWPAGVTMTFGISVGASGQAMAPSDLLTLLVYDAATKRFNTSPIPYPFTSAASGIAVAPDNSIWLWRAPDAQPGLLKRYKNGAWRDIGGLSGMGGGAPAGVGIDIAIDPGTGDVFAISPDYKLFKFNPATNQFALHSLQFSGNAAAIAVERGGTLWIVDVAGKAWQYSGSGFVERRPNNASGGVCDSNGVRSGCIRASAGGGVFTIDQSSSPHRLLRWNAASKVWDGVSVQPAILANIFHVAVDPDGRPWIANGLNIFRAR